MTNYSRCKIRVYPRLGKIDLSTIKDKIDLLKQENTIYERVYVFYDKNLQFAEIRYTSKWGVWGIDEVFSPDENELWMIKSNESGASDMIQFISGKNALFSDFEEKAIYTFDQICLNGDQTTVKGEIERIFGYGIRNKTLYSVEDGLRIDLGGLYTSNNFFYSKEDDGEVVIEPLEKEIIGQLRRGEMWDMIFHIDGIEFKKCFYDHLTKYPTQPEGFPHLKRIEFLHLGRISSQFGFNISNEDSNHWEYMSDNGFWNCVNPKFITYEAWRRQDDRRAV